MDLDLIGMTASSISAIQPMRPRSGGNLTRKGSARAFDSATRMAERERPYAALVGPRGHEFAHDFNRVPSNQ
jgi:hypothetical protein